MAEAIAKVLTNHKLAENLAEKALTSLVGGKDAVFMTGDGQGTSDSTLTVKTMFSAGTKRVSNDYS